MSLTIIDSIVLGLIQGVSEWLPVSSKSFGILYLVGLRGFEAGLAYSASIWLHIGSFPAALVIFRRDIASALRALLSASKQGRGLLRFLIIGTLGSGIVGVPLYIGTKYVLSFTEASGRSVMFAVGLLLLATAALGFLTRFLGSKKTNEVGAVDALVIGIAQGFAAVPGLSRSGLTIFAASWLGYDGESATSLSFLLGVLGVPAIAVFDFISQSRGSGFSAIYAIGWEGLLLSSLAAFAVSLALVKGLLALARRVRTGYFVAIIGVMAVLLNLPGLFL